MIAFTSRDRSGGGSHGDLLDLGRGVVWCQKEARSRRVGAKQVPAPSVRYPLRGAVWVAAGWSAKGVGSVSTVGNRSVQSGDIGSFQFPLRCSVKAAASAISAWCGGCALVC